MCPIKILLVDTDVEQMHRTARMLQTLLPNPEGLSTTDPLLAAKYAFDHPVDLLIAGLNMKRMNGFQLSNFLREQDPELKVCLFGTRQELEHSPGLEKNTSFLPLPIQENDLRNILQWSGSAL